MHEKRKVQERRRKRRKNGAKRKQTEARSKSVKTHKSGAEKRGENAKRERERERENACDARPIFPLRRAVPIDLQWTKVWRNPTPISRRYSAAWTIILDGQRLRGCTLSHTREPGLWLFTQLTRLVLGIAWAHRSVRAWANTRTSRRTQLARKLERSLQRTWRKYKDLQ